MQYERGVPTCKELIRNHYFNYLTDLIENVKKIQREKYIEKNKILYSELE